MKGFTEDEARQIFARAAERQHAVEARGEGLSLDELQAIGAEVGLDPAHVAAAVAELRATPSAALPLVFGVDAAPRRARVLPGEMTDAAWGQLVSRLKRTFGSVGIVSEYGVVREWTSGPTSNLHVVAEAVEGGTRLTIETRRENASAPMWGLSGMGVAMLLMFLVLGVTQGKLGDPVVWALSGLVAFLTFGGAFGAYRGFKGWSETRSSQFEALLGEAEAILAAPAEAAARLDPGPSLGQALDGLADPDDHVRAPSDRTRTRS
jgi:hypothetical protein